MNRKLSAFQHQYLWNPDRGTLQHLAQQWGAQARLSVHRSIQIAEGPWFLFQREGSTLWPRPWCFADLEDAALTCLLSGHGQRTQKFQLAEMWWFRHRPEGSGRIYTLKWLEDLIMGTVWLTEVCLEGSNARLSFNSAMSCSTSSLGTSWAMEGAIFWKILGVWEWSFKTQVSGWDAVHK